jgi:2-polyprenyl-3-methyl-5-hydroxy-6-metoxy-1,4-benzoquinol methylase
VTLLLEDPSVSKDITGDHYERLAATYDENWTHSPAFLEWMTECIQRRLRIGPGDLAADIGCGTGMFARGLARYAAEVTCVEPSAPMLARLPYDDRLIPIAASVEELASGRVELPHRRYDAMLLKEMIHHVDDRAAVIAGLARLLRTGGRMLVVMLPTQISYPLFAEALRLFTSLQPDPANIAEHMQNADLETELSYESFSLTFPADRYLHMVRNRYMSLLSYFDDAQLEAGIAEIQRAHPGERITFRDTFAFVLGTNP